MTHRYLRAIGLVLAPYLLVSSVAAQTPWTVTVTPTVNPLPIGTCGAVRLAVLDPQIRDIPRNPSGNLVTIADFDLTVSVPGGNSVVGQYLDRSNWSVCACQGAAVGAEATITATYPGKLLSTRTLVPGIAFQTTEVFSVAPAKSSWNPTGCPAPTLTPVSVVAGTPISPLPPASPKTVTAAPTKAGSASRGGAIAPLSAGSALPPGPAPSGVTVTGTPALARVTWGLVGASSYSVQRWMQNDPNCCRASSPQLGAGETGWDDPSPLTGTYVYRVTANYADGRQGFVDVNYVRPEPTNPATLTVGRRMYWQPPKGLTPGYWSITVTVAWTEVPGAAYYILWGPGQPAAGTRLNTTVSNNVETHQTSVIIQSDAPQPSGAPTLTWGMNTWTVGAFFLPGPVNTVTASFTKGTLDLQPCAGTWGFC